MNGRQRLLTMVVIDKSVKLFQIRVTRSRDEPQIKSVPVPMRSARETHMIEVMGCAK